VKRVAAILLLAACIGPQDNASQVHDLRVLGASFEPPEILAPSCAGLIGALMSGADGGSPDLFQAFFVFAFPIEMKFLIEDPNGGGRPISWDLRGCVDVNDLTCTGDAGFVPIAQGATHPGELTLRHSLGLDFLDGGTPLLQAVIQNDIYKGLGGFRVPVVLHVKAGEEEVYAQKLMVYWCKLFDEQKQNVTPKLRGMNINGVEWLEGETRTVLSSDLPVRFSPIDFSDLEEAYVVPSFTLKPIHLNESWKISWHTTLGQISPTQTGGINALTGGADKHRVEWDMLPDAGATETDVDFWFVVRDGRGGESWITRRAHYVP
jgi:hypothetical protein